MKEVEKEPTLSNGGKRYPLRERRSPWRFPNKEYYMLLTNEGELESFEEAKRETHNRKWLSGMQDENHTLELTELPKGKMTIWNKWVYKLKLGDGKNPPRYKAKNVIKGF